MRAHYFRLGAEVPKPWDPILTISAKYQYAPDWDCHPMPVHVFTINIAVLGLYLPHIGVVNYKHYTEVDIKILCFTLTFNIDDWR